MPQTLVLLNASAGTLNDVGADRIREALTGLGKGEQIDIRLIAPKRLSREIAEAARSDFATVIVGGGDGSANCAATHFANTDKVLGILPFGTVNLLARDLGMPSKIEDAIAALRRAEPRRIDLATVNGRIFHSVSGLGFFSQMARAREETRGHVLGRMISVGVAAMRALRRTGRFSLDLSIDGKTETVDALAALVTSSRFGADWRRPRLDDGLLEVHIAEDAGTLGRLKASTDLLTGGWRDNPGIRSVQARAVTIDRGRHRAWVATDGELTRERMPLRYSVIPRALTVLCVPGD